MENNETRAVPLQMRQVDNRRSQEFRVLRTSAHSSEPKPMLALVSSSTMTSVLVSPR